MTTAANLALGLLLLEWLLWRQTTTRPFDPQRSATSLVILTAVGLLQISQDPQAARVGTAAALLIGASIVAAAAFGAVRAGLMRLWRDDDGRFWRAGTAASVALWLVPTGLHLGVDHLAARVDPAAAGLGADTLVLYLAVTLGAQRLVLAARARRMGAAAHAPTAVGW